MSAVSALDPASAVPRSLARSTVCSKGTDTKMRRSHRSMSSGRRRKTPSKSSTASAGAVEAGGDDLVSVSVSKTAYWNLRSPPGPSGSSRTRQQRDAVVGVEVAAFGRVPPAPVALRTLDEEVVDGRADHVAALRAQDDGELVGQRGLAGGGWPVDGDPQWVRGRDGRDRLGQSTDELAAGALVLAASVTVSLYSTACQAAVAASRSTRTPRSNVAPTRTSTTTWGR